jgi:hypothetical protein
MQCLLLRRCISDDMYLIFECRSLTLRNSLVCMFFEGKGAEDRRGFGSQIAVILLFVLPCMYMICYAVQHSRFILFYYFYIFNLITKKRY